MILVISNSKIILMLKILKFPVALSILLFSACQFMPENKEETEEELIERAMAIHDRYLP